MSIEKKTAERVLASHPLLLKFIACGAAAPHREALNTIIQKHQDEFQALNFVLSDDGVPLGFQLADFIGDHWPADAGQPPDKWLLQSCAIALVTNLLMASDAKPTLQLCGSSTTLRMTAEKGHA